MSFYPSEEKKFPRGVYQASYQKYPYNLCFSHGQILSITWRLTGTSATSLVDYSNFIPFMPADDRLLLKLISFMRFITYSSNYCATWDFLLFSKVLRKVNNTNNVVLVKVVLLKWIAFTKFGLGHKLAIGKVRFCQPYFSAYFLTGAVIPMIF